MLHGAVHPLVDHDGLPMAGRLAKKAGMPIAGQCLAMGLTKNMYTNVNRLLNVAACGVTDRAADYRFIQPHAVLLTARLIYVT